jgi:hypothetical protein
MNSHNKWDDWDIAIIIIVTVEHKKFKCIEYMNKKDKLYEVYIWYTKFLKYDLS